MEMSKEVLAKAKEAKTVEELLALAKENDMEMTEESAKEYFDLLHPQTGEVSDDELDNVSGGVCHKNGKPVVTALMYCDHYKCKSCGGGLLLAYAGGVCNKCGKRANCLTCSYCIYQKGLWLCDNPKLFNKH